MKSGKQNSWVISFPFSIPPEFIQPHDFVGSNEKITRVISTKFITPLRAEKKKSLPLEDHHMWAVCTVNQTADLYGSGCTVLVSALMSADVLQTHYTLTFNPFLNRTAQLYAVLVFIVQDTTVMFCLLFYLSIVLCLSIYLYVCQFSLDGSLATFNYPVSVSVGIVLHGQVPLSLSSGYI